NAKAFQSTGWWIRLLMSSAFIAGQTTAASHARSSCRVNDMMCWRRRFSPDCRSRWSGFFGNSHRSRERNRSGVNRQKKFGELVPVRRVGQSIHATRSRASVRHVVQHGGKRIGCAIVGEGSREGKNRQQRRWDETGGAQRRSRVGADFVE